MDNPISYISRHWRGQLSLVISYWVNIVTINILFSLLGSFITNPRIFSVLCGVYIIVFIWQIVGCWRSATNYIRTTGRRFWARVVQILLVIGVIFMILQVIAFITIPPDEMQRLQMMQEQQLEEVKQQ